MRAVVSITHPPMSVGTDPTITSVGRLMRCCLPLLVFVWATSAVPQDGKQALIAHVKALSAATTDAVRDSINPLIKQELRVLLNAPDGPTAPMDDIPLSRVDAPDGSFRLITWNLARTDGSHQYEGFLLSKSGRGNALTELRDKTNSLPSPEAVELGPDRWYGALYYHVIPVKKGGKTWYTLLGWKGYSKVETRKVIEVLSFRGGKPRFGAALFGAGRPRAMRKSYGYSFQTSMVLRWEPEMEAILMDHLSPSRADMVGQPAYYGPDMTHDAYFWYKGEWWLEPDIDARDLRPNGRTYKPPPRPSQP